MNNACTSSPQTKVLWNNWIYIAIFMVGLVVGWAAWLTAAHFNLAKDLERIDAMQQTVREHLKTVDQNLTELNKADSRLAVLETLNREQRDMLQRHNADMEERFHHQMKNTR